MGAQWVADVIKYLNYIVYIGKWQENFNILGNNEWDLALLNPVNERRLEVLHLIAAGFSNREIAEKIFISLNPVQTDTKNINSKLNVNSRIQAVARAKGFGLL